MVTATALSLAGVLILGACSSEADDTGSTGSAAKKTLVISLDSAVDVMDPQQWRTPASMVTSGSLVEQVIEQGYSESNGVRIGGPEFTAALAKTWEYSPDGSTLTITLRDGLKFADGSPLTAGDVVWSYQRGLEMTTAYTKVLYPMVGLSSDSFTAVDERTVRVESEFGTPLMDKMLAMQPFGIFSKKAGEANATPEDPWAGAWFRQNSNSSGPYVIGAYDKTTSVQLTPNPNYYDQDRIANGGVTIQFISDPAQRALLLRNGELDLAGGLPLDQVAELSKVEGLSVHAEASHRLEYLGLNTTKAPFDDKRVRRAISLALPYQTFVDEVLYGYADPASGLVSQSMETHAPDSARAFTTDLAEAKQLLADAGVDGFESTLSYKQSSAVEARAAVYIQSALKELGITVQVKPLPDAEFTQRTIARDLEMYLNNFLAWGADPFYQMASLAGSGAGTNFTNYANPKLDALLQTGFRSVDPGDRDTISAQAQAMLIEEMPTIPLWNPKWVYVTRDGVSGLTKDNTEQLRLQYLSKR
jgi:peptide/nickel transport system substrate-binding protein